MMKGYSCGAVALGWLCLSTPIIAQSQAGAAVSENPQRVGNYRTREERREAGLGTELTDWLTFSGLLEVESLREALRFDQDYPTHRDRETDPAVQAAFESFLFDLFEVELILEYTEDSHDPLMDELIIAGDVGDVGFSVGRFYAPFGLYYSHFITGPMLEFGEMRRDIVQIDYDYNDRIEFALFAFDSKTRQAGASSARPGWGAGVDAFLLSGRLNVGFGYLSNLAETEARLLREAGNVYSNRVGAWNAYLVYEGDTWDVSLERLQATGRFREFPQSGDKPVAWNLEAAYFPTTNMEFAVRYERSNELLDEPEQQVGLALTLRLANHVSMTTEYLRARYKSGFVEEEEEIFARHRDTLAFWIAFEF